MHLDYFLVNDLINDLINEMCLNYDAFTVILPMVYNLFMCSIPYMNPVHLIGVKYTVSQISM